MFDPHAPWPFNFLSTVVPLVVVAGFAVIAGSLVWNTLSNLSEPTRSRPARVVAKRLQVWTTAHPGDGASHVATGGTSYFVTFDFAGGERKELKVPAREYGLLVEGDRGTLTFRGTWFRGFEREQTTGRSDNS